MISANKIFSSLSVSAFRRAVDEIMSSGVRVTSRTDIAGETQTFLHYIAFPGRCPYAEPAATIKVRFPFFASAQSLCYPSMYGTIIKRLIHEKIRRDPT